MTDFTPVPVLLHTDAATSCVAEEIPPAAEVGPSPSSNSSSSAIVLEKLRGSVRGKIGRGREPSQASIASPSVTEDVSAVPTSTASDGVQHAVPAPPAYVCLTTSAEEVGHP